MRVVGYFPLVVFIILTTCAGVFLINFQGKGKSVEKEHFVVGQKTFDEEKIIDDLVDKGFLKNKRVFNLILDFKGWHGKIHPGGYFLANSMNAYELAKTLTSGPSQKWVVIPPGKRKEQTALILKEALDWPVEKVIGFIKVGQEGYLYPDTYLIDKNAEPEQAVRMMKTNFERYFDMQIQNDLLAQNIRSDTAIKIASLIERESGSGEDKPLIAGIIWNRLLKGMRLEIDATVQYALASETCQLAEGKAPLQNCNFWPRVAGVLRTTKSPYNTYLNKGLPPGPIASPSLASIRAVAYPADTDALYYLHSSDRKIHIAKTLKEHEKNIQMYLE